MLLWLIFKRKKFLDLNWTYLVEFFPAVKKIKP